jgi:C4-dicarboxylate transporter DctM subunit
VLNKPFIFTEEVSRYSYVWITFIGMSLATKTSDHIRVDFFVGLLGPSAKALVSRSVTVISLLLMIYLCYLGIQFVIFSSVNYSAALQIPLAFVYISFPIGCVLTAVRLARISLKKGGE